MGVYESQGVCVSLRQVGAAHGAPNPRVALLQPNLNKPHHHPNIISQTGGKQWHMQNIIVGSDLVVNPQVKLCSNQTYMVISVFSWVHKLRAGMRVAGIAHGQPPPANLQRSPPTNTLLATT